MGEDKRKSSSLPRVTFAPTAQLTAKTRFSQATTSSTQLPESPRVFRPMQSPESWAEWLRAGKRLEEGQITLLGGLKGCSSFNGNGFSFHQEAHPEASGHACLRSASSGPQETSELRRGQPSTFTGGSSARAPGRLVSMRSKPGPLAGGLLAGLRRRTLSADGKAGRLRRPLRGSTSEL